MIYTPENARRVVVRFEGQELKFVVRVDTEKGEVEYYPQDKDGNFIKGCLEVLTRTRVFRSIKASPEENPTLIECEGEVNVAL